MTVKELREKLAGMPDDAPVAQIVADKERGLRVHAVFSVTRVLAPSHRSEFPHYPEWKFPLVVIE